MYAQTYFDVITRSIENLLPYVLCILQTYYWVTDYVQGWQADDECEKVSGGRLAEATDKDTFDFFVNTLHPDHNRKFRVVQV